MLTLFYYYSLFKRYSIKHFSITVKRHGKKNELAFCCSYNATIDDNALSIDASYEIDGIEENIEVPIEFQIIVESGKQKEASSSDVRVLTGMKIFTSHLFRL